MKLHLEFSSDTGKCKAYRDPGGQLVRTFEMRDKAVNEGFAHWGRCPRGTYGLGAVVEVHDVAFGDHFIPLLEVPGRRGIGIHGGGSGLPRPFSERQGWMPTLGCLRVQNVDLKWLVEHGGEGSRLTVVGE